MARDNDHRALALVNDINEVEALAAEAPASERQTVLPPAPPSCELDVVAADAPGADLLSLAALEAALNTLPFDEEPGDVLVLLETALPQAETANDGISECDRPTRRYSVPDVPPCMRPTARP